MCTHLFRSSLGSSRCFVFMASASSSSHSSFQAPVMPLRRIDFQVPYDGNALKKDAKYLVDGEFFAASALGADKDDLLMDWQGCHAQRMANFHFHRNDLGKFVVFQNGDCSGCRAGTVPSVPPAASGSLLAREESKSSDDISDLLSEYSNHSLLLSRFPRPVLVAIRDGSFPPVALSKLLEPPPPPCDAAALTAWFACALAHYMQLHLVFRPVDHLDLHVLFDRLMHWLQRGSTVSEVQGYFDAWRKKFPRHAKKYDFFDADLVQDFITSPQSVRGQKRPFQAPAFASSLTAPAAKKRSGPSDAKSSHSPAWRHKVFQACIDDSLCGHFQFGACPERGDHTIETKKNGTSSRVSVKHICVCCAGAHGLAICPDPAASSKFPG
jgi:hypothetical protein